MCAQCALSIATRWARSASWFGGGAQAVPGIVPTPLVNGCQDPDKDGGEPIMDERTLPLAGVRQAG
jgi:hypothetical protein